MSLGIEVEEADCRSASPSDRRASPALAMAQSFVLFADDVAPRWLTASAVLDANTVAGADKFGNIFVTVLAAIRMHLVQQLGTPRGAPSRHFGAGSGWRRRYPTTSTTRNCSPPLPATRRSHSTAHQCARRAGTSGRNAGRASSRVLLLALADWNLGGGGACAQSKSDEVVQYHVGETVTSLQKVCLVPGCAEVRARCRIDPQPQGGACCVDGCQPTSHRCCSTRQSWAASARCCH